MRSRAIRPSTLSEYIAHLQTLEREFGGSLLVQRWSPSQGRHHAPLPEIAYMKVIPYEGVKRGGLVPPSFWQASFDPESQKGERVVRI